MVPATVAAVVVTPEAAPDVTVGTVFTPLPVAATFMDEAPPPPTTILPL